MSPDLTLPAQSELESNKMSVAQLEQFVSFIVKRSCSNGADPDHVAAKPKWWPHDLAFSYPIARTRSMDLAKWRETLLDVVARCYTYRSKDNTFRHENIAAARNARSASNHGGRRKTETEIENKGSSFKSDDNLSKQSIFDHETISEFSPVVSLCDVLKLQPKENVAEVKPVSKNDFLNYFKLSDTQNCSVILNNNVYKAPSHPLHLINSHQVPFSSDLGKRMTKECHIVPLEIHQRKIERVERYLTTVINTDTAKAVEYEITYNRVPQYSHTYVFPSKIFRRKERISSKATFLLMKHCKPCTIKLENLKIIQDNLSNKLVQINHNVPTNVLKENKEQKTSFENIIDHFSTSKENTPTAAPPIPPCANKPSKNISIRDNKKENSVLKTLVPKNSVLEGNIIGAKLVRRKEDLLNASVLLTPINGFFGLQSAKSVNSKTEIKPSTKNKNSKVTKINRVQKRRVLIYHPRRFSLRVLRLKCITNNKS